MNGNLLEFGVSGNLINANVILWDHTTESWWQQLTGEAIVGDSAGLQLNFVPVQMLAWGDYKAAYPDGEVLSLDTGYPGLLQFYGKTQYYRYDAPNNSPQFVSGAIDNRLPPKERVVAVAIDGKALAFPYQSLEKVGVVNYDEGDRALVIFYKFGTASPLDEEFINDGKEIGSSGVFTPVIDGQRLTFSAEDDGWFTDEETGSVWDITGKAVSGELAGARLERIVHQDAFWFAWSAFRPDAEIVRPVS